MPAEEVAGRLGTVHDALTRIMQQETSCRDQTEQVHTMMLNLLRALEVLYGDTKYLGVQREEQATR